MLSQERWMNLRQFRKLKDSGASLAAIARETGCDYRTVKKYLDAGASALPPTRANVVHPPQVIEPFKETIDEWLRREPRLQGTVIHQRLVTEEGFTHSYQRVKMYLAEARERVCPVAPELHRRFEVLPGSQAQVDWGDEGVRMTEHGLMKVYSFHMTLSYSRDPFVCFTTSQDLVSFWDCHQRAFEHFAGVPASILYDRTKTVVRRHVGPGQEVPLHPEALAFAAHYGFSIHVAAAYRPQTKGRVERQVSIVREHVLRGRDFASVQEMDQAFMDWLPIRRAQVHRTHGQVIAVRADIDRAALSPLPVSPYNVTERHLRRVAKDCLISFEGSLYSLPWREVRRPMHVEVRVTSDQVHLHRVGGDTALLATHARSRVKGTWVVDETHWDGLATGTTTSSEVVVTPREEPALMASRSRNASVMVHHRDLSFYDRVGAA
jgi:transposase